MPTKELTAEVRERLAARATNEWTAAIIRSGVLERITDHGTVYARPDVLRRELAAGAPDPALVTRVAPAASPPAPLPPTAAAPAPRAADDSGDLLRQLRGQHDADDVARYFAGYLRENEARTRASEEHREAEKAARTARLERAKADDVRDRIAEFFGGVIT